MALAFAMAMGAVAFADTVHNNSGGSQTIAPGGSVTVKYALQQAGTNCVAPVTVSINTPAGVTANPTSLTFNDCVSTSDIETQGQAVVFGSNTVGSYNITVTCTSGCEGTGNDQVVVNPAAWTLIVEAPAGCDPAYTATFHRPLDADGVLNTFKNGRVIPVKVSLTDDCNDNAPVTGISGEEVRVLLNTIALTGGSTATDAVTEFADAGQSSGNTSLMRWSEADGFWIYNLDSKALGLKSNSGYQLWITVDDTKATESALLSPTK